MTIFRSFQNQFWNDLLLGNLIELKKIKERAEEAEIKHSGVGNDLPCGAKEGEQLEETGSPEKWRFRELTEEILGEKYLGALFL